MLIYFWVVLVISPAGFLEDLLGCSAICIICDSYHIVSILKCMCSQNKVIHSLNSPTLFVMKSVLACFFLILDLISKLSEFDMTTLVISPVIQGAVWFLTRTYLSGAMLSITANIFLCKKIKSLVHRISC